MITIICLWWIGTQLEAAGWYYALLGIGVVVKLWNATKQQQYKKEV